MRPSDHHRALLKASLHSWYGFVAVIAVGIIAMTSLHYGGSPYGMRGTDLITSFQYGVMAVGAALAVGLVIWLLLRAFRGEGAPELKEGVLWYACIGLVFMTAAQLFR